MNSEHPEHSKNPKNPNMTGQQDGGCSRLERAREEETEGREGPQPGTQRVLVADDGLSHGGGRESDLVA